MSQVLSNLRNGIYYSTVPSIIVVYNLLHEQKCLTFQKYTMNKFGAKLKGPTIQ